MYILLQSIRLKFYQSVLHVTSRQTSVLDSLSLCIMGSTFWQVGGHVGNSYPTFNVYLITKTVILLWQCVQCDINLASKNWQIARLKRLWFNSALMHLGTLCVQYTGYPICMPNEPCTCILMGNNYIGCLPYRGRLMQAAIALCLWTTLVFSDSIYIRTCIMTGF